MKSFIFQVFVLAYLAFTVPANAQSDTEPQAPSTSTTESSQAKVDQEKHVGHERSHGSNFAGYRQPCGNGIICDSGKKMSCDDDNSTCECELDVMRVYSLSRDSCLEISTNLKAWACEVDEQCTGSSYGSLSRCNSTSICECFSQDGRPVVKHENVCYIKKVIGDVCTAHKECNVSIEGEAACIGLDVKTNVVQGICGCKDEHFWSETLNECLRIGSLDSSCKISAQCQDLNGLGNLSRCNEESKKCQCWAAEKDTGHLNTKCYLKLGLNETCTWSEECIVGYHQDAVCMKHEAYHNERICRCKDGKKCDGNLGIRVGPGPIYSFLFLAGVWVSVFIIV